MKEQLPNDREFNTPAEMLTRATFLAMLLALCAGILLTIAGLVAKEIPLLVAGIAALAAAWAGRSWLQRRGELEPSERALNVIGELGQPLDETHSGQLQTLLQEWERMEKKRGSSGFDPWALQAMRNDIRKVVESDPALTQLFTESRRAA